MTPRNFGTIYRQKGSRFWWIQYFENGQRKRFSSESEDRQRACDLLKEKLAARPHAAPLGDRNRTTIDELVEDLLAWYQTDNPRPRFCKDTRSRWDLHLKKFFGELKASELATDHLRAYRAQRTKDGAAFATINRELQILRKAYKLAAESEPPKVARIPKFKGSIGKEKNARKVFIDLATAQKLRAAAAKEGLWVRVFLELALTLGWRKSELEGLKVENIRFAEKSVRIEDSKNGEPREVPITDALRMLLQPLVLGRDPKDSLWPVKQFRYAWKRVCKAAGVKAGKSGIILHDARRTSARNKRAAGTQESTIMDIHGWKTAAMFRRYAIVDQADRLRALVQEEEFLKDAEKRMEKAKQIEMFGTVVPRPDVPRPEQPGEVSKPKPARATVIDRHSENLPKPN